MSTTYKSRTFDRIPRFDDRSRAFGITQVAETPRYESRIWLPPSFPRIDQDEEGACVGHAVVNEAGSSPVRVDFSKVTKNVPPKTPQELAFWAYYEAQMIDQWPGEDYDGTSVLAGIKVMQRLGVVKEYRWGFSEEELRLGLQTTGPAVLGINWYSGMYTAPRGYLQVSGRIVGGHAIVDLGYKAQGKVFDDDGAHLFLNSWGPGWGQNGLAWIRAREVARLLREDGEACIPYRRSYGR